MTQNGSKIDRTGVVSIEANERHTEWLRLRAQGFTCRSIGERYGVTRQAVSKAVIQHLAGNISDAVDELRELESERLEQSFEDLSVIFMDYKQSYDENPDNPQVRDRAVTHMLQVQDRRLRVSERYSRLHGLDKPVSLALLMNPDDVLPVEPVDVYEASLKALAPPEETEDDETED